MEKLRFYINSWIKGKNIKGVYATLSDMHECMYIYGAIKQGFKPTFISGNVKKIMDVCDIRTKYNGVGWQVA